MIVRRPIASLLLVLVSASSGYAQVFTFRGFAEGQATVYPQTAPNDDDQFLGQGRIRFEPALKPASWLGFTASLEARGDNLEQTDREWRLDYRDRGVRRPALSLRQAAATLRGGGFTVDLGRQFIRWGIADILTPTDRFAPRDYLENTEGDFLAVTGGRVQFARGPIALDVVAVPTFTPSRIPLLNSRWAATPPQAAGLTFADTPPTFPSRAQFGARWNVIGSGYEFAVSYFDGFNNLPEFSAIPDAQLPTVIDLHRSYAPLKMAGGDAAVSLKWVSIKGEVASMTTTSRISDDVVLYVIQLERQAGELSLVGGYSGEVVTTRRSLFTFAPDRGLARAILGRASYMLDTNRTISVEAAVRQNARGMWVKGEYSHGFSGHWRTTIAGTVIRGKDDDFFGQYRRNSHVLGTLRYSF